MMKLRAIYPACFAVVVSTLLHAEEDGAWLEQYGPSKNGRGKVQAECCPPWTITPEAGPCVCDGWGAYLTADFIYWTAREDHLGYGYRESFDENDSVTSRSTVHHPDWNFEPGFKIGFGVLQNHDGWDIYAQYTWLRVRNTKDSISIEDIGQEIIVPIGDFAAGGGLLDISQMAALWELDFNVVDLSLGRNFYISHCLSFRPHFGMKGTWQEQRYAVDSVGFFGTTAAQGENRDKLDYWGVGIRGGLDSCWHITRCFSFIGDIAVSAFWERFVVDSFSSYYPTTSGSAASVVLLDIENRFFTIKPVIELYLAFQWQTWFCCDTYRFSFQIGWEQQWWADQNQFFLPLTESRQGDLFFHGGTAAFRLDF